MHFLKKNEKQNKSYVCNEGEKDAKKAILRYEHLSDTDRYSFLEVELITGRHHQIRAQLSDIGCVIKGDLKYGASRSNKDGSIHLHAHSLSFVHPVRKEKFCFTASHPHEDSLWKLFSQRHSLCIDKRHIISENKAGCTENFGVDEISGDTVK
jgi:23S rRNA pseudouridine1911/1915/1917 synthase